MRILFLTDNFPPEGNAPASRTYEHAIEWVKRGHDVTVITTAPNFPEGVVFDGYSNQWHSVEGIDGIRVVRVKTYIVANQGFGKRTLDYMSFGLMGCLAGLFEKRADVIVGTSPQFFTVCSAWLLSVLKWRPFVFELRDLWPASIRAVGAMQDGIVFRTLSWIEKFLYRRAAAIVAVTHSFRTELIARGIDADKIYVVINGVDTAKYSPTEKDAELTRLYGLKGKFVVGYIGTHGMAHALHRILETADLLRHRDDIVFVFVGGGARRDELVRQANKLNLQNVRFVERQPKEQMPRIWSLCDVSLISLKNDALFRSVIPSKIFESMGMGLPIILSLPEGEASEIIKNTGSGLVVEPENPERLKEAVIKIKEDTVLRERLSCASADSAESYSRKQQAEKMLEIFQTIAD
ncbi:MAG: glycosyltransferase family 4 protein [Gammaproteobacteria bacterium]|nr:glycosyltransferase family 4 protein [Gammaproteobacteria bacterium]